MPRRSSQRDPADALLRLDRRVRDATVGRAALSGGPPAAAYDSSRGRVHLLQGSSLRSVSLSHRLYHGAELTERLGLDTVSQPALIGFSQPADCIVVAVESTSYCLHPEDFHLVHHFTPMNGSAAISCIATCGLHLLFGSETGAMAAWTCGCLDAWPCAHQFEDHLGPSNRVLVISGADAPCGYLSAACTDTQIAVWHLNTGKKMWQLATACASPLRTIVLCPFSLSLFAGCEYHVHSFGCANKVTSPTWAPAFRAATEKFCSMAVLGSGSQLAVSEQTGRLLLFHTGTGDCLTQMEKLDAVILLTAVGIAPVLHREYLLAVGTDHEVVQISVCANNVRLTRESQPIIAMQVVGGPQQAQHQTLFMLFSHQVSVLSLNSGRLIAEHSLSAVHHQFAVRPNSCVFLNEGGCLALACDEGVVAVLKGELHQSGKGVLAKAFEDPSVGSLKCAASDARGLVLVAGSKTGWLVALRPNSRQAGRPQLVAHAFQALSEEIIGIVFCDPAGTVLCCSAGGTIKLLGMPDKREPRDAPWRVHTMTYAREATAVVAATEDCLVLGLKNGAVQLFKWVTDNGQIRLRESAYVKMHAGKMTQLQLGKWLTVDERLTKSCKSLISASSDCTVRLSMLTSERICPIHTFCYFEAPQSLAMNASDLLLGFPSGLAVSFQQDNPADNLRPTANEELTAWIQEMSGPSKETVDEPDNPKESSAGSSTTGQGKLTQPIGRADDEPDSQARPSSAPPALWQAKASFTQDRPIPLDTPAQPLDEHTLCKAPEPPSVRHRPRSNSISSVSISAFPDAKELCEARKQFIAFFGSDRRQKSRDSASQKPRILPGETRSSDGSIHLLNRQWGLIAVRSQRNRNRPHQLLRKAAVRWCNAKVYAAWRRLQSWANETREAQAIRKQGVLYRHRAYRIRSAPAKRPPVTNESRTLCDAEVMAILQGSETANSTFAANLVTTCQPMRGSSSKLKARVVRQPQPIGRKITIKVAAPAKAKFKISSK